MRDRSSDVKTLKAMKYVMCKGNANESQFLKFIIEINQQKIMERKSKERHMSIAGFHISYLKSRTIKISNVLSLPEHGNNVN